MESSTFPLKQVYRAKDAHIFFTRFHLFLCTPQLLEIRLPAVDYCLTMNTLSTIPEAKVPQASDHAKLSLLLLKYVCLGCTYYIRYFPT